MTVIVGVRCTDGVVLGADSIATSVMGPMPLMHVESNSKIQLFSQNIIVATTGSVGLQQRLAAHVEDAIRGNVFRNLSRRECTTNISRRVLTDFQQSFVPLHGPEGLRFGALLAAPISNQPCLVEYQTTDFQPEIREDKTFFVSMGSGQILADPFLAFVSKVLWNGIMPSVEAGKFGVYWVLNHTIRLAPGHVGGPPVLAVLRRTAEQWATEEIRDTQEQAQYIEELEEHIGRFVRAPVEEAQSVPPPELPPQN